MDDIDNIFQIKLLKNELNFLFINKNKTKKLTTAKNYYLSN